MRVFLITLLIPFVLWSCTNGEGNVPDPKDENKGEAKMALSFEGADSPLVKSFGSNTATAVEKKVISVKLFIFRSGNKIFEKLFTSSELTNVGTNPITFTVPGMLANTAYNYYMIINNGDVSASNLTALSALTMNDITSYNGAWAAVNDAAATPNRSGGFVMQGMATVTTTADLTQTQAVTITVKRITAKLDITATIDNTVFGSGNKYGGAMSIDSAIISRTQNLTPLLPGTPTATTGTLTLGKQLSNPQTVNSIYQNRFYVFENGTLAIGSRVLLTLYGTYTYNGVSTLVVYSSELTTDNTAAIVRNGSYVINAAIKGLTGASLSLTITLADWETIVTQSINMGT